MSEQREVGLIFPFIWGLSKELILRELVQAKIPQEHYVFRVAFR